MDVCGHNESGVELNLRTLREKKNQRIEKFFLFSCSVFSKKMYVFKRLKEKTLKNPFHQGITVYIINYIYYK